MPLPDYNFLSAPLWLITVLHILTLSLHFVAMNFLVGGIIIVLWGKFTNRWEDPTVKTFVKLFPSALAATVTLGVAPLLFVQLVYHRQVYAAAIVSGWFWMMIIVAVIIAYYFLYGTSFSKLPGAGRRPVYLTLALLLFLYVSVVLSSVFSMAEKPHEIASLYQQHQAGMILNPDVGDWLLRWLHMILGAITVGGFFIGWLGKDNPKAYEVGKGFFLWGMVVTSVVGISYLLSLSDYLSAFMKTPGAYTLTLAILLSAGSLHFFFKKKFVGAGLMLFVSLLGMVINRHIIRLLKLTDHFEPSSLKVEPQWSVFLMFLICFVIALGVVWYMLKLFFGQKQTV